ncbi:hypothetical protein ACFX13_001772 [Malus domestica]
MAISIPFFQQVTGINVISFYSAILCRTIGLGESASLLSVAVTTGVVGTSSTFVSMLIVDKFGRRALFLAGGIQMLVSQTMVGGVMAAQLGDRGGVSKGYADLVIVAGFGWSWGPLGCWIFFKAGIFFFFGCWVAVMTVFVYLFLPETKNVPIEKMEIVWQEHWFWRRIVGDSSKDANMEAPSCTYNEDL